MSKTYFPLNKPSRELLLDLINDTNNINPPLTFDQIALDPPVALRPGLVSIFDSNTKVIVKDVQSTGYVNSRLVYYDRLAVSALFEDEEVVLSVDFQDVEEAIVAFNDAYGLALDIAEIAMIEMVSERRVELTIGTSYAYLPGSKLALNADTELTELEDRAHRVWYYANYELPTGFVPQE